MFICNHCPYVKAVISDIVKDCKDLELEGVNLLKILDKHEIHSLLMPLLIKFVIIKKIIDKEKPTKIICSSLLSKMVKLLIKNIDIETQFFQNIGFIMLCLILMVKRCLNHLEIYFTLEII